MYGPTHKRPPFSLEMIIKKGWTHLIVDPKALFVGMDVAYGGVVSSLPSKAFFTTRPFDIILIFHAQSIVATLKT